MKTESELFQAAIKNWWEVKEAKEKAERLAKLEEAKEIAAKAGTLQTELLLSGDKPITKKAPRKKAISQGGDRNRNLDGKTMNGFVAVIKELLAGLGVKDEHVFCAAGSSGSPAVLPSIFRPSKTWDLIVCSGSRHFQGLSGYQDDLRLYAAMEFKSQEGSIGNNQNNRIEESIGNAYDLRATAAAGGFGQHPMLWAGYFFVGKYDANEDKDGIDVYQPHFLALSGYRPNGEMSQRYKGPKYAERYQAYLKAAIADHLYNAGSFIEADVKLKDANPNHRVPDGDLGPMNFLTSLKSHILGNYPDAKIASGSLADQI